MDRLIRKRRTISAWGMLLRKKLSSWQASDFQGREIPAGREHLFHAWQSPTNGGWNVIYYANINSCGSSVVAPAIRTHRR